MILWFILVLNYHLIDCNTNETCCYSDGRAGKFEMCTFLGGMYMSRDLKCNSRSFRFSNRVLEILESFEGDTLNSKFENLVLYCFDKLPEIKHQCEFHESLLSDARQELHDMWYRKQYVSDLIVKLNRLDQDLSSFWDDVN